MMQGVTLNKAEWLRRARTSALCVLAVLVAVSFGVLLGASDAYAKTFRVNSMEDAGDNSSTDGECATDPFPVGTEPNCTLRAAIGEANFNDEADTIIFDSVLSGTISLTLGQLEVADDTASTVKELSIQGPGARTITVSANEASRVFRINDLADVTISGLTISGGKALSESPEGGGIYNGGTLELINSTVRDNTATVGPSSIFGGGGIYNGGMLKLSNSTVSGNAATFFGGGITNRDTLDVVNSTMTGNSTNADAGDKGGGIYNMGGTVTLANSTVSRNTAANNGGGIFNDQGFSGTFTIRNTIIARNSAPTNPDAGGTFSSQGNNLISDITGSSGWVGSDLLNQDPLLGPLQNNGGPTDTQALLPGSPAVDAANNAACALEDQTLEDQRGVVRKDGDGNGSVICDIGAFERSDLTPPKVSTTGPAGGAMGVRRGVNLTATFTEKMSPTSITNSTFKLFKVNSNGSTTQITNVTVALSSDGLRGTLNPFGTSSTLLGANTNYKAVVTTQARDRAGNQLDQSPTSGRQQKAWTFKTGST